MAAAAATVPAGRVCSRERGSASVVATAGVVRAATASSVTASQAVEETGAVLPQARARERPVDCPRAGGGSEAGGALGQAGYFHGVCVLQVLSTSRPGDEDLVKALREAQTCGRGRVLYDKHPADLDAWEQHGGPAVVLAPHGPDGIAAARNFAGVLHRKRCERLGACPAAGHSASDCDCYKNEREPPSVVSFHWPVSYTHLTLPTICSV